MAFLGGAFLQPLVAGHANPWLFYGAMVSFLALQGALHYVLYRVEDYMDPFVRLFLILWFAVGGAFAIHWFFMRGYAREKKQQQRERTP